MESLKMVGATWFFARGFVQSILEYAKDDSQDTPPSGIGLGKPLPETLPGITEIKAKIPKHCFESSVPTSLYYAVKDVVLASLTLAAILYVHQLPQAWLWWPALMVYWTLQGTIFTAFFVIGHDCGHESFSRYPLLNDTVGTLFHSFLLCPYYMWKLTHKIHHKNNANMDRDEVFYPVKESENNGGKLLPGFGYGVGWFGYLVLGYRPRNVPHFDVIHPAFRGHILGCCASTVGVAFWGCAVYRWATLYGWAAVLNYYLVPVFIFASYCVIITFLHHSEVDIPWYANDKWDFVRGQLSTVDRHYGAAHDLLHSIGTHQMHHLFSKIPHYHLEESTRHFRANFPELVRVCDERILPSFMRMFKKYRGQGVISDNTEIHVYK